MRVRYCSKHHHSASRRSCVSGQQLYFYSHRVWDTAIILPMVFGWHQDRRRNSQRVQQSQCATRRCGQLSVVITNSAGSITSPPALLQVLVPLPLTFQGRSGTTNTISFQSALGTTYTLQFKNSLTDTSWTDIPPSTNGTGTTILLRDTTASRSSRFYRLLLQ